MEYGGRCESVPGLPASATDEPGGQTDQRMTATKVRFGIVGTGGIANTHAAAWRRWPTTRSWSRAATSPRTARRTSPNAGASSTSTTRPGPCSTRAGSTSCACARRIRSTPSRWSWPPSAASTVSSKNRSPPRWRTPTGCSRRRRSTARCSRRCRSGAGSRPRSASARRSTRASSARTRCWASRTARCGATRRTTAGRLARALGHRGRRRADEPGAAQHRLPAVVHGPGRGDLRLLGATSTTRTSRSKTTPSPSSASAPARWASSRARCR